MHAQPDREYKLTVKSSESQLDSTTQALITKAVWMKSMTFYMNDRKTILWNCLEIKNTFHHLRS